MDTKKPSWGWRIFIAFVMSLVPFLLLLIPEFDDAVYSVLTYFHQDYNGSPMMSFYVFGLPGIVFFATLLYFMRKDDKRENAFNNVVAGRKNEFVKSDIVLKLSQQFADDMARDIKITRPASVRTIECSNTVWVNECRILLQGHDEFNFDKNRVYLAHPKEDSLAIAKAICERAASILAEKFPHDPSGGIRTITCEYHYQSHAYGSSSVGKIYYDAENGYFVEAKPLL